MIDHPEIRETIRRALAEDIGAGDVTSQACVAEEQMASGRFIAKHRQLIAGMELLPLIYEEPQLLKQSGDFAESGETIALRSEERRVGKEGRSRWSPYH